MVDTGFSGFCVDMKAEDCEVLEERPEDRSFGQAGAVLFGALRGGSRLADTFRAVDGQRA